jgi:hypothetical protein
MTAKELQQNIEEIANELGCVINQKDNMSGMMYVEEEPPRIEGPIIKDNNIGSKVLSYYIMLHELGHVYHGHTQGRPPFENKLRYFENGILRSEAEAWKFALDNAIIEPNQKDVDFMIHNCIMSYYESSPADSIFKDKTNLVYLYNGDRHYHNGKYEWDEADEYFWNVVKQMENSCKTLGDKRLNV